MKSFVTLCLLAALVAAVTCRPEQQAAAEVIKSDADQPVASKEGDLEGSESLLLGRLLGGGLLRGGIGYGGLYGRYPYGVYPYYGYPFGGFPYGGLPYGGYPYGVGPYGFVG
ncbi:sulfur globule protein CV1-like [Amphibalanus amphitrite]|uniref:sulfur globule protein CV1-like n=1 Tax=Amphibalanus amphitrite TaxID=1232801 RepID=UPI001C8FCA0D|nr:sulfur globule protein CV1-like [Amphibalanus amphitrite]